MSTFNVYFRYGYDHILNLAALDHILFIIAIMAVYQLRNWLKIVIAISLFTVGHSIALTLAVFEVVHIDKKLVEFLIPLTIVITALFNLTRIGQNQNSRSKYWLALLFGLIHGLGFSNYYQMLILGEKGYASTLLPFNLGVEVAQIVVMFCIMILMAIFQNIFNRKVRDWNLFVSGTAFGLAAMMCFTSWPF